MAAMLKGLNVVVLFVSDLHRARSFYRETLGMRLLFEDENSAAFDFDSAMLMLLTPAGARDLLTDGSVADPRSPGATFQLVSFVDDVDATYRELVARGVEFVREPIDREWGMRTAHFKDSEGNIWEIAKPMAKQPEDG